MKRFWLIFSQSVTVVLAAYFVVVTLKPQWLNRPTLAGGTVTMIEAPASGASAPPAGSFSAAARKASPAVVSINTAKAVRRPSGDDPWFRFFFGEQGSQEQHRPSGEGVGEAGPEDEPMFSGCGHQFRHHHHKQGGCHQGNHTPKHGGKLAG